MISWAQRIWGQFSTRQRQRQRSVRGVPAIEMLEPREVLTVTFHGGALLDQVEVQGVYYGAKWNSDPTAHAQVSLFDGYLNYLVDSPYTDALASAGYNVGAGTAQAGVVDAKVLKKHQVVKDSAIRQALQADIDSHLVEQPDANRLYIVFVQPGNVEKAGRGSGTSKTRFLGYHDHFAGHDANGIDQQIYYAIIPYHSKPNAFHSELPTPFDSMTSTVSHEFAEAVTDPVPGDGWYDDDLNGEIGDLTQSRVILNGYYVQQFVDKDGETPVPIETSAEIPLTRQANAPRHKHR